MSYMVDTNIVGNLASGELALEDLPQDGNYVATPIQLAELGAASGLSLPKSPFLLKRLNLCG